MKIKYARQKIDNDDINAVTKVLKSDFLTTGKQIENFETKINNFVKSKYCVATNSATSALHISCQAMGLKKDDWLWTSPISFVASANCGLYCDAKIDFVDINLDNFLLCEKKLEKKLIKAKKNNKLPKIIVVVHLSGHSCAMDKIYNLSLKYKFKIIEDASHSIGGSFKSKKIGSCRYSDVTVFSFHPVKTMTTAEGGAVCTNNKKLYEKVKILRSHGITRNTKYLKNKNYKWYYEQRLLGYNYRLNEIQSALGISQLKKIKKFVRKKNLIKEWYLKGLKKLPISFQDTRSDIYSSYHLFIIRVNSKIRNKINIYLNNKGIQTNLHYIPIYRHPYFKKFNFNYKNFSNSEKYYREAISLPMHVGLSFKQVNYVIKYLKKFFI